MFINTGNGISCLRMVLEHSPCQPRMTLCNSFKKDHVAEFSNIKFRGLGLRMMFRVWVVVRSLDRVRVGSRVRLGL